MVVLITICSLEELGDRINIRCGTDASVWQEELVGDNESNERMENELESHGMGMELQRVRIKELSSKAVQELKDRNCGVKGPERRKWTRGRGCRIDVGITLAR